MGSGQIFGWLHPVAVAVHGCPLLLVPWGAWSRCLGIWRQTKPWDPDHMALGQSQGGGYHALHRGQVPWVQTRALAALMASPLWGSGMSQRRAAGPRAGGTAKAGTGGISMMHPHITIQKCFFQSTALTPAQQKQRSCHGESPSHHWDISSPIQQCYEGSKSWKSFFKSTLSA